jgi:hypothetical protein
MAQLDARRISAPARSKHADDDHERGEEHDRPL